MAADDIGNRIAEALSGVKDDPNQAYRKLARVAYEARDADDIAGYEAACAAFGPTHHLPISRSFRLMYSSPDASAERLLVLHERHGARYLDASGPDGIATAALSVLAERLRENYYDDGKRTLPVIENPVSRIYLDAARSWGVIREVDPSDQDQLRTWRRSPEFKEVQHGIGIDDLLARFGRETSVQGDKDDLFVAFIALACILRNDYFQHEVAAILRASAPGPMSERVARTVPVPPAKQVQTILDEGRTGSFRLAGRHAINFLETRSGAQYERAEFLSIEIPTFEVAPPVGSPAPSTP